MSDDSNPKKYAVDTMVEVTKQLLTLASGFIVLSVSLLDAMIPDSGGPAKSFGLVIVTWVSLVLSIMSGLLALGAIAATAQEEGAYNVDDAATKWLLRFQQILFVIAFTTFVCFAIANHGT